jgi:hypothetical protein
MRVVVLMWLNVISDQRSANYPQGDTQVDGLSNPLSLAADRLTSSQTKRYPWHMKLSHLKENYSPGAGSPALE